MGWVTLDDGQHVYIGSGGKVLATRSGISATAGGRERMGAMRSKAQGAVHQALARSHGKTAPEIEHAKTAGNPRGMVKSTMQAHQQAMNRAQLGGMRARAARDAATAAKLDPKVAASIRAQTAAAGKAAYDPWHAQKGPLRPGDEAIPPRTAAAPKPPKPASDSPATARAIEHARAAGPSLREQADRARAGKVRRTHH